MLTKKKKKMHWQKIRKGFRKNAGEWTGKVEISKEEMPGTVAVSVACMAIY